MKGETRKAKNIDGTKNWNNTEKQTGRLKQLLWWRKNNRIESKTIEIHEIKPILATVKERKFEFFGHAVIWGGDTNAVIEGNVDGKRRRGRPAKYWIDNLRDWSDGVWESWREEWKIGNNGGWVSRHGCTHGLQAKEQKEERESNSVCFFDSKRELLNANLQLSCCSKGYAVMLTGMAQFSDYVPPMLHSLLAVTPKLSQSVCYPLVLLASIGLNGDRRRWALICTHAFLSGMGAALDRKNPWNIA